jgi:hypothetical protein
MANRRAQAAIVTTLKNAGNVLDSFIAYHLAIGFAHIFLFFDDPADPDLWRAAAHPAVTAIAHDAALRQRWRTLPQYSEQAPFIDREVMARQVLNVEFAMELARQRGFDWLLNIDSDELFFSPYESAADHFDALSGQSIETMVYLNYEAMPERDDVGDFFREVDLFKVPPELNRRPITPDVVRAVKATPQFDPDFFLFYGAGKSAVRLSAPGMQPNGVHSFVRRSGPWQAAESRRHFILHYACCGFDAFWSKYVTLGRFADQWWEKYDIAAAIGRFHLDARDVVACGDQEAARAFYRQRVAMEDKERVDALIALGVLARFPQPRQILDVARQR